MSTEVSQLKPIAFSVADAARYVGLSRSTLYELNSRGVISFTKVGRRTLVPRTELDRLITSSSDSGEGLCPDR